VQNKKKNEPKIFKRRKRRGEKGKWRECRLSPTPIIPEKTKKPPAISHLFYNLPCLFLSESE
jgi:hypothetical protein